MIKINFWYWVIKSDLISSQRLFLRFNRLSREPGMSQGSPYLHPYRLYSPSLFISSIYAFETSLPRLVDTIISLSNSSQSSSIYPERVGQERSPTTKRLNARPILMYTSSTGGFDSEIEWVRYHCEMNDEEHPADEFNPNQKLSLMTLPPKIRDRIFSLVAEP